MTTPPPESTALSAALSSLLNCPPTQLARYARLVSRAADDAEVAAAETSDPSTRHALMEQVDVARGAALTARNQARQAALAHDRHALLQNPARPNDTDPSDSAQTAHVAREINDGLRRVTALVKEQVDRSRAAGGVLDESSRRLRMTRDRHASYGHVLASGAATLKDLKTVDLIANVAVLVSFVFFFLVAGYVVNRRLARSNTVVFIVRPAVKIVTAPVRLANAAFSMLFKRAAPTKDKSRSPTDSKAQQADLSDKATKGREQPPAASDNKQTIRAQAASDTPNPGVTEKLSPSPEHQTPSTSTTAEATEHASKNNAADADGALSIDIHESRNQGQQILHDHEIPQDIESPEADGPHSTDTRQVEIQPQRTPSDSPMAEIVPSEHTYTASPGHSEQHSEL